MNTASLKWFLMLMVFFVWGCSDSTSDSGDDSVNSDVVDADTSQDTQGGEDVTEDILNDTAGEDVGDTTLPEDTNSEDGLNGDTTPEPDVVVCVDEDGDGLGDGCEAGLDCNDDDENLFQILNGYMDSDGDLYGAGEVEEVCSGDELPQVI